MDTNDVGVMVSGEEVLEVVWCVVCSVLLFRKEGLVGDNTAYLWVNSQRNNSLSM